MKSRRILRVLCLFGFLLLITPFYKQCNGHFMKDAVKMEEVSATEAPAMEEIVDSVSVQKDSIDVKSDSISSPQEIQNESIEEKSVLVKAYLLVDDPNNQSIIELAIPVLDFPDQFSKKAIMEFQKDSFEKKIEDIAFWIRSFSLAFIILFTTLIFILSFFNKIRLIWKLTIANLVLIAIILSVILFFDPFFETYKQIKWGFYVFTMIQVGILFFTKKNLVKIESK